MRWFGIVSTSSTMSASAGSKRCSGAEFGSSTKLEAHHREAAIARRTFTQDTATWHIAMPAEEPSTASEAATPKISPAKFGRRRSVMA